MAISQELILNPLSWMGGLACLWDFCILFLFKNHFLQGKTASLLIHSLSVPWWPKSNLGTVSQGQAATGRSFGNIEGNILYLSTPPSPAVLRSGSAMINLAGSPLALPRVGWKWKKLIVARRCELFRTALTVLKNMSLLH